MLVNAERFWSNESGRAGVSGFEQFVWLPQRGYHTHAVVTQRRAAGSGRGAPSITPRIYARISSAVCDLYMVNVLMLLVVFCRLFDLRVFIVHNVTKVISDTVL